MEKLIIELFKVGRIILYVFMANLILVPRPGYRVPTSLKLSNRTFCPHRGLPICRNYDRLIYCRVAVTSLPLYMATLLLIGSTYGAVIFIVGYTTNR